MKWKFNIVKQIVTPIEIEADNFGEALNKARALETEIDTDHGRVAYCIDTIPSWPQITWLNL